MESSLDISFDYNKIQKKVEATKAYTDLKDQYKNASKKSGESFEKAKNSISQGLSNFDKSASTLSNNVTDKFKSYERKVKNQFEQLLDLNNITGGKGSNSIKYVKRLLLTTLKNIEPKIKEILLEEIFKTVGCDQNQTYPPSNGSSLYISVRSIDLLGILKIDPTNKTGRLLYEKDNNLIPGQFPYSMNKQLYDRIQSPVSFDNQYGSKYIGKSTQDLFDIQYQDQNNFGVTGGWFKVDLQPRANNYNSVKEFLVDYYSTLKVTSFPNIMANIMQSLTGAISIKLNVGTNAVENATKFEILLQRILGLCFDNRQEIDVSGNAKIAELDGVDNSFFEFTEIDLRTIEQRINNIKEGVIQFEECDFVKFPVNANAIIDELDKLFFVEDNNIVDAADNLTNTLINDPNWNGLALRGNVDVAVNTNFVKLIINGLIFSLLTPKVLLPIFIMLKSLGQNFMDGIDSIVEFMKKFSSMAINLISKIGALFVRELFQLIKKDIVNLIQQVIRDVAKEISDKRIVMILKLIQILLIVAQLISDWRRCKSVIDELLQLLSVLTSGLGYGSRMPLPLLFAAQVLDGYSESRAFLGAVEELQKLGIPTGAMPDGSPNLDMLSKFGQMKAMAMEDAENGKVQIAIGPLALTPAGLTIPATAFGKKF